jgi:hypothetical protein
MMVSEIEEREQILPENAAPASGISATKIGRFRIWSSSLKRQPLHREDAFNKMR